MDKRDLKYIDELLLRGQWFLAGELLMNYLSRPYRSISFWNKFREQEDAKNSSVRLAFSAIRDELLAVYGPMNAEKLENFMSGKTEDPRTLGDFKDSTRKNIRLKMTSSQLIKRWMELQDATLLPTFKSTMHYTDEMIHAITESLTADELAIAGWMLKEFYPGHMTGKYDGVSIDKRYGDIYGVYLTSLLGFDAVKPTGLGYRTPYGICYSYVEVEDGEEEWERADKFDRGTREGSQAEEEEEEDEPVCDKDTVLLRLIRSYERIGAGKHIELTKPLKLMGAYESVQKYVIEMENFKAFSELRRTANSVLNVLEGGSFRKIVQQYHGSQALALLDRFLESFFMSGSIESQRYKEDCLICNIGK